ncbi:MULTISPECIES: hypothetical protein [Streptomyces]|uniref:hypothetical protein n=1 Tax=Streptomyces TaxID=1883 RepID=UPI0019D2C44A|nr:MULTISPECIES: hypothetical protein [Streptomyces]MDX3181421.1 hypothetical protein [Streptomyces sp. ME02-7008A-1]MDX3306562.1 hypothetical protein [Streptomyces sp. ME02-7008A]
MTQSGQGDERQLPAARPAHEGVVLPAEGGAPWNPGGPASGQPDQAAPAGGQPWGGSWGPEAGQQDGPPPGQLPPEQHQHGAYRQPQHGAYQQPAQQQYAPQPDSYQQDPYHQPPSYAQPLPPEAGPAGNMGQGGDADATQYIAPVPGGALPGGMPPEHQAESTQYLGHHAAPAQQSDADATQYIPPVPGGAPYGIRPGAPGDRQPPAEFDSLFRSDEPAGATQQMPRVAGHQQPPHQGGHQQQPQGAQPYRSGLQDGNGGHGAQEPDRGGDAPRRRSAAVPLIAAVVIGCAVVGLGAGALMSGGDDSPSDDKKTVAAQSPTAGSPSEEAADPAKPQAEELDKLLADSNNSRSAVISAVEKIKSCSALDQAATDLRGAAEQRRGLVTRLEGLSVDQLPAHAELKTSLTDAWQASAEADDHYAAWAVQAKDGKKVCKGGKARSTDETAKANASSGEATTAKRKASGLWNSIAQKYGLTERAPTQL